RVHPRLISSSARTQTEVCATFRNFQEANLAAVEYALPPNLAIGRIVMIKKMSHASVFVTNQEEALSFYRDKLGFKVHTDAMIGEDFRWLTVCPQDQPDFEIILMEPKAGMLMDEATSSQLRS